MCVRDWEGGTKAQYVGLSPQSTALWMALAWVFWDYCCRLGDGEASAQLRCSSLLLSCLSVGRHVCRREPPPLHFSHSHSHTHTLIEFRWGGGMRLREEGISFIKRFSLRRKMCGVFGGLQRTSSRTLKNASTSFFLPTDQPVKVDRVLMVQL